MSANAFLEVPRRIRRLAGRKRQGTQRDLGMLCRVSRAVGWLLTGRRQTLCSILHLNGWHRLAAITDLVCFQREGMSFHCARMAEMDQRLERIERRRSARAIGRQEHATSSPMT